MATETIILRPTKITHINNLNTIYPSDTPTDSLHLLVNEEHHDDDATYISTSGVLYSLFIYYDFSSIIDYVDKILSMKFYTRVKSYEDGGYVRIYNSDSGLSSDVDISGANTYDTYLIQISDAAIIEKIADLIKNDEFHIEYQHRTSDDSKQKDVRVTQMYLEVEYESNSETSSISILSKQNGVYSNISGSVYHKENGVWVKAIDDLFLNNNTLLAVIDLSN